MVLNRAVGDPSRSSDSQRGFARTTAQGIPTMATISIAQTNTVLIAIDIAKLRHDVSIAFSGADGAYFSSADLNSGEEL